MEYIKRFAKAIIVATFMDSVKMSNLSSFIIKMGYKSYYIRVNEDNLEDYYIKVIIIFIDIIINSYQVFIIIFIIKDNIRATIIDLDSYYY